VAILANLSNRLRSEIGDIGKSFVYQVTADGITNRYLIPYSPLDGMNLVVTVDGVDVSALVEVEEATGYVVFDTIPEDTKSIVVAGNYYRYFTDTEIDQFISTAYLEHTTNHTDAYGRSVSLSALPTLEEYPVIVYASTLSLYTLATDASFDINVFAPDGVTIPRSERFQQLMQMVQTRKDQYKELCSQLGVGLFKIDVFTLRRTSKTTNRYVPVFMPMEVDDRSQPIRLSLPLPTYGSVNEPTTVVTQDLYVYEGDDFTATIRFSFELDDYTAASQIRLSPGSPHLLQAFATSTPNVGDEDGVGLRTLRLTLTQAQTRLLPSTSYYDVQLTDSDNITHTYVRGKVFKTPEITV